jgi:hypothetical protein
MHRDANEAAIFDAFKAVGCSVITINHAGAPDAVVFCQGRPLLVEIKQKHGRLTPAQERFHAAWTGPAIHIVRTVDDALKLAKG